MVVLFNEIKSENTEISQKMLKIYFYFKTVMELLSTLPEKLRKNRKRGGKLK